MTNKIINDFGNEWEKFNFNKTDYLKLKEIFNDYFNIFPVDKLNLEMEGFDMGGGSGRWSFFIAEKVKKLNFIDPSTAIQVAKQNLKNFHNIQFFNKQISDDLLKKNSQDFGFCLGVLHHTYDVEKNLKICTSFLKKDSPFLLYLYYNFDNRSNLYRLTWKLSDYIRVIISNLPNFLKNFITDIIAFLVYFPLSRISKILHKYNFETKSIPLSYYKDKEIYILRNDSRDRFGTTLEKRFTKNEINNLMLKSDLKNIKFSKKPPYWVAIGYKK